MSEPKHFIVTWPELNMSVECEPNPDGSNLWIYNWYVEHMPFEFLQLNALCTGGCMYTWFGVDEELPVQGDNILVNTPIDLAEVGTVHMSYNIPNGLAGGRIAHFAINWGPTYEEMPGYFSARVCKKDIPTLVEAGKQIAESVYRTKKVIHCKVTVKEE